MKSKLLALCALTLCAPVAFADDWACEVVLCLANPRGATAVTQCIPPIKKLWRELAKGHAFPTCNMNVAGAGGNSASHAWASGAICPPQYRYWGGTDGVELLCEFSGVVTVRVANQLYTRVWWNDAESFTEDYSGALVLPADTPAESPRTTAAAPAARGQ